jgi:hypothetical protein
MNTAHEIMENVGALFDVDYAPAGFQVNGFYTRTPLVEGKPMYKWVNRLSDDNECIPLAIHKSSYPEVDGYKHLADMAEFMFPLSSKECTLFGNGERVLLVQQLTDPVDLGDGDTIQSNIIWVSSLNGSWSTKVYDMTERFFCRNQLIGLPLISVRHTTNHDNLLSMRVEILEGAKARADAWTVQAREWKDQEMIDREFFDMVSYLMPIPEYDNTNDLVRDRIKMKRNDILNRWYKERDAFPTSTEPKVANKWCAYNAFQGAEQHYINAKGRGHNWSRDRALIKAVDGKTPLATQAFNYLQVMSR